MQKIHNLHQTFLCLVLSGYILKADSGFLLHIHLGIGLSDTHDAASTAAHTLRHAVHKPEEKDEGQNHAEHDL